jgi:LmbE family N-acetylglucosaminyl deacetylase
VQASEFLKACENLPMRSIGAFQDNSGFVIVAPHPDDESLGCGGLIRLTARRGWPVHVVILTDGSRSHPRSRRFGRDRLRRIRESEARAAVRHLGLSDRQLTFLRFPDEHAPHHGVRAFRAAARVADVVIRIGAQTVVVTWGKDPHCDHQAAHAIVRTAQRMAPFRMMAYPIWAWSLAGATGVGSAPPRGFRLDVRSVLNSKTAAVRAHRSQLGMVVDDDPSGFRLDENVLARAARPYEIFLSV